MKLLLRGIISNFKARRAKHKIEKIANKMDNDEKQRKFKEDSKKYLPVIKKKYGRYY